MAKLLRLIGWSLVLLMLLFTMVVYSWPVILQRYVEGGIGNCGRIPILCKTPSGMISDPAPDKTFTADLVPQKIPGIEFSSPKGFDVVEELIHKPYFKKWKRPNSSVMYVLREKPEFFIRLFPDVKKYGVFNNPEFVRRTLSARPQDIRTMIDAFFVIMKSIFIPDLGNQQDTVMTEFKLAGYSGFINYTLSGNENYFDCNFFNQEGEFFKFYIKDKDRALDLTKVFSVLATVKASGKVASEQNP